MHLDSRRWNGTQNLHFIRNSHFDLDFQNKNKKQNLFVFHTRSTQ